MDTSKEYIKMCEKATEIQEFIKDASVTYIKPARGWGMYDGCEYDMFSDSLFHRKILLPRQDQLQEMVIPDDERGAVNTYVVLLDDFQKYVLDADDSLKWFNLKNPTLEQLWLAFAMRRNYDKKWNGEDWVKI